MCNYTRVIVFAPLLLPFYSVFLGFSNCKWYLFAAKSFSLHNNIVNKVTFVLLWVVMENFISNTNFWKHEKSFLFKWPNNCF